jgi:hypothetical protein
MPARSDLNPGDIPALLPHLMLVDKVDDRFRYRLVGTAVEQSVGHDATGSFVGSYLSNTAPEVAASALAIYDRVFTTAHPNFSTGEFDTKSGTPYNMSLLVLPLSDDGTNVNMAVSSLVTRLYFDFWASEDWLQGLPVRVRYAIDVASSEVLERLCLGWERHCNSKEPQKNH